MLGGVKTRNSFSWVKAFRYAGWIFLCEIALPAHYDACSDCHHNTRFCTEVVVAPILPLKLDSSVTISPVVLSIEILAESVFRSFHQWLCHSSISILLAKNPQLPYSVLAIACLCKYLGLAYSHTWRICMVTAV